MDDNRIDSQGFSIGRWYFPPFCLRRAECVTLCFPKEALVDQARILACLTGSEEVTGLTLNARIVLAKYVTSPAGWRRWFHNPTPLDWMKKHTTLSEDAIQTFLAEHGMDQRIPLNRYGGTPRMVLGLVAAYARKPDVVVYSTAGLDPRGVGEIHQLVSQHLPACSAICLAWPFFSQGHEHHGGFPGSLRVAVLDKAERPTAGIPGIPTTIEEEG